MSYLATNDFCTEDSAGLNTIFPVRISAVALPMGRVIRVLREDLLDGGTKSRALRPFLLELVGRGYREFCYASPFAGFAQLALSFACRDLGLRCRIFAEADPNRSQRELTAHPITQEAESAGAGVTLTRSLDLAEEQAAQWTVGEKRLKIPLGLDCEGYRRYLSDSLREVWNRICWQTGQVPGRVWVSLGSGTLSTALREILPPSVELCCLNVHVLPKEDPRIQRARQMPNTRWFNAPIPFAQVCGSLPPVPSNVHYDAKVWSFLDAKAEDGDLWWNVAR